MDPMTMMLKLTKLVQDKQNKELNNEDTEDTQNQSEEESMETNTNGAQKMACAHCSEKILIKDVSQFEMGQHLCMPGGKRALSIFYQHHAILKRVLSTFDKVAELELIHFYYTDDKQLQIVETIKHYDLKENEIYYIKYRYPRYKPDVVVSRAENILKESKEEGSQFKKYSLLNCNCEHFATWCVVGVGESFQVQGVTEAMSFFSRATNPIPIFSGVYNRVCEMMEERRNINKYEEGNMCRQCLDAKNGGKWGMFKFPMFNMFR